VLNISRLKDYRDGALSFPSRPSPDSRPPPEVMIEDGAEQYEVKSIIVSRASSARARYLVKWLGYPHWEATWEKLSSSSLSGARDAIAEYERVMADHGPI
jgi:hypothetical protein